MTLELELCDGRVICKFDTETGEILDLCDWNGNEVSWRWEKVATERVAEYMAEAAEVLCEGER